METCTLFVCLNEKFRMTILLLVSTSSKYALGYAGYLRLRLRKIIMLAFVATYIAQFRNSCLCFPSLTIVGLTFSSHDSNLFLSKMNPYNLSLLL